MAPKRKGEPVKQPKKRGRGRPPKAAQAAIAAPVADREAEPDVQEEPEQSLDVVAKCVECSQGFGTSAFTMHICDKGDDCESNPMAAVCHECLGDEEAFRCSPCKELPVTAAEHNKVKQALKEAQLVIAKFQQERAAADKGTRNSTAAADSEPTSGPASKGKQAQAMSRRYNVLERAAGRAGVRSERNPKRLSGETHNN